MLQGSRAKAEKGSGGCTLKSLACLGDELVLEPVRSKDPWRFLFTCLLGFIWGFPSGSAGKEPACQCRQCGFDLWEDALEEEMAPHSSILAWKIPWTEESGGLQSMGSQSQTRLHVHMSLICSVQAWLPHGMWDLSSPTRGRTHMPCI